MLRRVAEASSWGEWLGGPGKIKRNKMLDCL